MELSYLLITPYSLRKSRTGGILSRILARSGLELVGARMFASSRELVEEFAGTPISGDERHSRTQDSVENAKREMDIIRMAENNLSPLLHAYLS